MQHAQHANCWAIVGQVAREHDDDLDMTQTVEQQCEHSVAIELVIQDAFGPLCFPAARRAGNQL